MPCPTCDHTMQLAAHDENGVTVHWCPRCGTLRLTTPRGRVNDEPPKLVARVQNLVRRADDFALNSALAADGILEACYLPGQRPA